MWSKRYLHTVGRKMFSSDGQLYTWTPRLSNTVDFRWWRARCLLFYYWRKNESCRKLKTVYIDGCLMVKSNHVRSFFLILKYFKKYINTSIRSYASTRIFNIKRRHPTNWANTSNNHIYVFNNAQPCSLGHCCHVVGVVDVYINFLRAEQTHVLFYTSPWTRVVK